MSKKSSKSVYRCTECGYSSAKWLGKCFGCNQFDTLAESVENAGSSRYDSWSGQSSGSLGIQDLRDVEASENQHRYDTRISELNRVLGGGLVMGGVVLLGGEPGIGKSTMILQASDAVAKSALVLYCTGEESAQQVSLRAKRLGMVDTCIKIDTEIEVEKIISSCQKIGAKVLVIDSIQTMYTGTLESAPGSVSQVRECAAMLNRFAKTNKVSVLLIGHVTKDGGIAGPRVLEHLVDTVLFFEGEPGSPFRILRSLKNRFGSANEIGVFSMGQHGLEEVLNPSSMFLTAHEKPVPGTCVLASAEGNRSFLVEVQALVEDSVSPNPHRQATGLDSGRIQMLLAVLAKHCGIDAHGKACYIKIVGGVKLTEPAADLPTLLAVVSSFKDKALPAGVMSFGEVGLAGEVRPVQNAEVRLKEAAKLGFKYAIIPAGNIVHESYPGIEVKRVSRLDQALYALKEIIENTSSSTAKQAKDIEVAG